MQKTDGDVKSTNKMTTVKACNSWGDAGPRKVRPPRIGDIPRHGAVDEESPISTPHPLIPTTPEKVPRPIFNESFHSNIYDTKNSSSLSSISSFSIVEQKQKQHQEQEQEQNNVQQEISVDQSLLSRRKIFSKLSFDKSKTVLGIPSVEKSLSLVNKIKLSRAASHDSNITHGTVATTLLSLTGKLSSIIFNSNESFCQESKQNLVDNIDKTRKDSAVCLEESEELNKVKDKLLENFEISDESNSRLTLSLNREIPPVYTTPCQTKESKFSVDNDSETTQNSSLKKYCRSRRESSGYFSNFSTFDDDRRNSTTFETLQSIDSSRERRRSSTKRLYVGRFIRGDGDNERMPSTEIYRKISAAGLEMPNIKELKEKRDDVIDDCSSSNDDLMKFSQIDIPPDSKIIMRKNPTMSTDKMTFDRVNDSDFIIDTSEMQKIDEITAQLCQSRLTSDELVETNDPSIKNIILSAQDSLTDVKSCTTVDSRCQEGRGIHNESLNMRRKMTPMTTKSCRIDESSSSSLSSSPLPSPRSQRDKKHMIHFYSSISSSNSELGQISEKPCDTQTNHPMDNPITVIIDDDDDVVMENKSNKNNDFQRFKNVLPKSMKFYQLLSTQSEDRGDDEPRLTDRRISLQINRHDDDESESCEATVSFTSDDKKLHHCDNVSFLNIPTIKDNECNVDDGTLTVNRLSSLRKCSSPSEICSNQRLLDDNGSVNIRPIYPYCSYSPYGSPHGSPRARRRPLRESRRVSIDNRQGASQLNQYKLLDDIGQGSFGIVKLAYNEEDGIHYAMKILSKKKLMKKAGIFGRMAPGRKGAANPLAKVYREIALLKKLDHPNVVKLVEVLDDPDEDNLYLVFELIQKGEVLQLPTDKPLDEETARNYFRDVVLGVEYLHYQRIVHRDIKPSNLLVDSEGHVKVADLGVSAELRASGELLSGSAGTPAFAAPETTILGAQYSGTSCDVWSMGVTLYSLVTGRVPWDGAGSIIGVQAAVRTEPLRFSEQPELSKNLRHLISRMLDKDPTTRLNLREIKTHCWLTNNGKDPLPNEVDNCRLPVTVTDEEVARVVTRVPKLDTLILIKTMLKQHSFQNPFLSKRIVRPIGGEARSNNSKDTSDNDDKNCLQTNTTEMIKSKTDQYHRAGRSNSAPDSYEWQTNGRQVLIDPSLTSVIEATTQEAETDKR